MHKIFKEVNKMKAIKLATLGTVLAIVFGAFITTAKPAAAQTDLGNLIVTNGLFSGYSPQGLAGLMAVDNMYGAGGTAGTTGLGNLLVLNGLFGYTNPQGLAGLIAVDNMYGGGGGF